MALIRVDSISVPRGNRRIIDNFSLRCEEGTITAIVGANGSGKSTLLGAMAGDYPLESGSISIDGREIQSISLSELSQLRSVVVQESYYWLAFTARQILEMGQDADSISRIDATLAQLNCLDIADRSILELSGGQVQRISIARALIRNTPIFLFDEPFSAQDKTSRNNLISIFTEMRSQRKTVVLVLHSDSQELEWCDQIVENLS